MQNNKDILQIWKLKNDLKNDIGLTPNTTIVVHSSL